MQNDPDEAAKPMGYGPDSLIMTQARYQSAIDNLEEVLKQAGYGLKDVVRLNVYTTDLEGYFANRNVMLERLVRAGGRYSSTLLGVARLARPEFLVEIEATAVL